MRCICTNQNLLTAAINCSVKGCSAEDAENMTLSIQTECVGEYVFRYLHLSSHSYIAPPPSLSACVSEAALRKVYLHSIVLLDNGTVINIIAMALWHCQTTVR